MKLTYKHTLIASYLSYIVQAIVNNLSPLLFVTFRDTLGVSFAEISLLITVNFALQIVIDLSSTLFIDRIGYRASVTLAEAMTVVGLIALGTLPLVMANKFAALLIATAFSSIGGGLIEVVVSPIVEAIPGDEKASAMSILHSFYCWGQAGVILLSTLYFVFFGFSKWYILPMLWAIVPFFAMLLCLKVPIATLPKEEGHSAGLRLFKEPTFLLMMIIMIAAGAAELAMSQWASFFAEQGLHVSKTVGDLLGPCCFALLMGAGRLFYGIFGKKMRLERWIFASFVLCLFAYLLVVFAPSPALSLAACALTGLSVALLWPGTYSLGAKHLPYGGTLMFALFAFAGDIGCTVGPDVVGFVSEAISGGALSGLAAFLADDPVEAGLKAGMLFSAIFPFVALIATFFLIRRLRKKETLPDLPSDQMTE